MSLISRECRKHCSCQSYLRRGAYRVGRLKVWLCIFVELKPLRFEEAAYAIKRTYAAIRSTIKQNETCVAGKGCGDICTISVPQISVITVEAACNCKRFTEIIRRDKL